MSSSKTTAESLSERQRAVLAAIPVEGQATIYRIAKKAFPGEEKARSWVRNQLRILRREGLIKKIGRGLYVRTEKE